MKVFGMARTLGSQLTESGQILLTEIVARQMQHGVLEGAGVSVGQDEAITIDPRRILAGIVHELGPQEVGDGGTAHGSSGMTRAGRLRLIGRDGTDRVDGAFLQIGKTHLDGRRGGCRRRVVVVVLRTMS